MKKNKKRSAPCVPEIVSLNEELFSLVSGNPLDALDRALAVAGALGGAFTCDTFTCGNYTGSCGAFACGTFKLKPI
jgi:hypothetical protein